jgi:Holliday junction DNA helicase RuvA
MIGYLRGEILENLDGKMIVTVSSSGMGGGAIGYAVQVPQSATYGGLGPRKPIELFVHTHVREEALDLYGFASRFEKEIFLTLLSVNGIGPKGALGILSRVEPESLVQAIVDGDREALTQVPGIGKKTAERVVLELGDQVRKKVESGLWLSRTAGLAASGATSAAGAGLPGGASRSRPSAIIGDAKAALVNLGYREAEVTVLLNRLLQEAETPPSRAEELVRTALRQLV